MKSITYSGTKRSMLPVDAFDLLVRDRHIQPLTSIFRGYVSTGSAIVKVDPTPGVLSHSIVP